VIGGEKFPGVGGQQTFLLVGDTTNSQDIQPGLPQPLGMNLLMVGPCELLVSNIGPQRCSRRTIRALRQGKGDPPHCLNVNHKHRTDGPQRLGQNSDAFALGGGLTLSPFRLRGGFTIPPWPRFPRPPYHARRPNFPHQSWHLVRKPLHSPRGSSAGTQTPRPRMVCSQLRAAARITTHNGSFICHNRAF
jgi:hypothetical protein